MSAITSDFIKLVASIRHRFSLENEEAETLTNMLAPMDDAGEEVSSSIGFDLEPSDYSQALEELGDEEELG